MDRTTTGHAEIDALFDAWDAALRAKDLDALAHCYAPDVVEFDIGSHVTGYDAHRELWESCFPYFPNEILCERRDVQLWTDGDVAGLSFLSRVSGMTQTGDPAEKSWYRSTLILKRTQGSWKIVHEHASMAYDFMENKPALILD